MPDKGGKSFPPKTPKIESHCKQPTTPLIILSHNKLAQLGLVWALIFLGHRLVLMGSGMQQGNPGRTCNHCVARHKRLGLVVPSWQESSQHPVDPQRHDTLLCAIFQIKQPCHRSIPVQLHFCDRCDMYAWVPTEHCQDHPQLQPGPVYSNSDNIDPLRQRVAANQDSSSTSQVSQRILVILASTPSPTSPRHFSKTGTGH
ncbi:uncharacterized protein PGTG_00891 [Puccinia graminis f. sp. tritici CRL 75-36-700-3]|uniref:Uncharacterized protein n=1 Tax=Puccinia graminis f. sp. tritici (strain CRL 75-36-700-3 / race SCCL) TaxID=418459 RepID=E3JU35_PUCGT|nr:uncharacterized protein PGTG_00891 [Puccinia graminis f. sp. tritici CRL 75-36-700-3]EFP75560.1 hypothetical protein PGTG_00891 [Puccinia graminis f. sp. tritici CRL 75-36-700-3]